MSRPSATEDVFRAVADPTRRAVLEALLRARELPVTDIAGQLGVGMPMLSRHLAILRRAGLVRERRSGRQRLYSLEPQPLQDLFDWASLFSEFWAQRMKGLRAYLDRQSARQPPAGAHTSGQPHVAVNPRNPAKNPAETGKSDHAT